MLNFLKQSRKFINVAEPVSIIIGNESCDLDSAASAISLAYFYQEDQAKEPDDAIKNFLPVLNIQREQFPLKTEVTYLFNKYEITAEHLTFRDELNEAFLSNNDIILVDHHVSPFASRCVEVFDHRPFDKEANLPLKSKIHMEIVGSCATLIGERILQKIQTRPLNYEYVEKYSVICSLLRNCIILDTVNLALSAGRTTTKDEQVCAGLEKMLSPEDKKETRQNVFEGLCKARAEVTSLNATQLIRKDYKIITNTDKSIQIGLPGFPISVNEFIKKPFAMEAVIDFANEFDCATILLIGMFVSKDCIVERDIGLININNDDLYSKILEKLISTEIPSLQLEKYDECAFMSGDFYKQENILITRKHILPLVKNVLDKWPSVE